MLNDTVGRLQNQINVLQEFCTKFGMLVNMQKTKIVVLRNGGPYRQNENWVLKDTYIEKVNSYKYLGVYFTSKLSWSLCLNTLAVQAEKSMCNIFSLEKKCKGLPIDTALKLFNTVI